MARYPIGNQDFKEVISGGYIYADKTKFIPRLLEGSKYYFLARPRRFGKSLFLSTLEYFFSGERNLFKGLFIDSYKWDWQEYPVIHIDLGPYNYTEEKESVAQRLEYIISRYEDKFGIWDAKSLTIYQRFDNLIYKAFLNTGRQVVVLVDEYEKPVLDNLDKPEMLENHKDFLRGFYSILKSSDKYLKLVFLTGVTQFGQMNIFSGLNNIRDISMNPNFGAICGITEEELISNFKEGIEEFATKSNIDSDKVLRLMKENYDGYHFCEDCPDIYNPYSLINAFADNKIESYWAFTGTPSLLANVLKKQNYNLEKLDYIRADKQQLMGVSNQFLDPVPLFYQTGYLTIKSYDPEYHDFILGYPNREVEKAFFDYLLPNYSGLNVSETKSFMVQFNNAIIEGKPEVMMETLEEFSAAISYDMLPSPEIERHFQYIIYIIAKLLVERRHVVKVEEKTSNGRIDLLITTGEYVYIIEIKRDRSPEEALAQIDTKEYALQFRNDGRKTFLIGMNFSTEKKRLDGYSIKEFTPLS